MKISKFFKKKLSNNGHWYNIGNSKNAHLIKPFSKTIIEDKTCFFSIDPAQGYRSAYGASAGALEKAEDGGGYLRTSLDAGTREENKQPLRPLPPHGYNTHHYQVNMSFICTNL